MPSPRTSLVPGAAANQPVAVMGAVVVAGGVVEVEVELGGSDVVVGADEEVVLLERRPTPPGPRCPRRRRRSARPSRGGRRPRPRDHRQHGQEDRERPTVLGGAVGCASPSGSMMARRAVPSGGNQLASMPERHADPRTADVRHLGDAVLPGALASRP